MRSIRPCLIGLVLALAAAAPADVVVKSEQLNPADPAWAFKTIPGPSRSDIASVAKISVVENQLEAAGGPASVLANGRLPGDPMELAEEAFLSNGNALDGALAFDLGSVQPVAAVSAYSWHEYAADQGARAPQVFTLYGSSVDQADPSDLSDWTKIADVDTRPNKTGENWNGQHGVFISDTTGKLGDFRHLLFAVRRTRSPLQPDAKVTGTLFAEIDVHTAATLSKAGDAGAAGQQVKEIIVVCKTHFDIGYTHRVKDLMNYYRTTMIDRALGIMDKSRDLPPEQQFVWTSPGWVMEKVLEDWPGQTPERRGRLETAFKSGKFVTHALPFSIEAELMEPEEFARGYMFADTVSRQYGLPLSRGAKTTDVPSQSRALATGLAHGGVKLMHIGCNWPSGYVHGLPPVFWWEGPDGSRVLTMYSSIYGTCTAFWPWGGHGDPFVGRNLLPPPDWPYKTWVAIIVTGDNSGPPSAEGVKSIFAEVAKKLPGARARMGTMEDFADALLAEKPDLPVVKGETPDTWIHGCMCDPGGMRTARNARPLLPAVEVLNTQLRGWGVPVADPAKELARAYEQSLLYSEHTWGGAASVNAYGDAFQKLPAGQFANLEGSWEDKTDYIREAGSIATSLLAANLAALAQAVNRAGPRVVVFNPLPWPRSGVVEVNGKRFFAKDVPPCGYMTLSDTSDRSDPADSTNLENEFFKVKLDPARGTIGSLVDKRTGREWVDADAAHGLGQYLNERFDKAQTDGYCRDYQQGRWGGTLHPGMHKPGLPGDVPYRAASPANGSVRIGRGGLAESAVMDLPGDPANHLPASELRVTLCRSEPYVDVELTIKDKPKDNWPEADWLCLSFKIDSPRFHVGRTLGIMDPATDILPGANRHLYAVGPGVALTDADGAGIAVCPLDHPLVSLDTPGMWKFSLDFVPRKPVVYLNLYNNQWNTNYRYWYPGTWSSRVRLWTFGRDTAPATALVIPSLEARLPLLAAAADGPAGALPESRSGIRVSRPGVLVTAFTPTLLRVWEQSGVVGDLTVTLPEGLKASAVRPVNLRGETEGEQIAVAGNAFTFPLKAFAPASFLLEERGP
jgi:alpha-mannosidase